MVGTVVGAVAIVVLTACFPPNRVAFLAGLAFWGAGCAFVATILRNSFAVAAQLAGITAAIIAGNELGTVGGANGDAFMLAVMDSRRRSQCGRTSPAPASAEENRQRAAPTR
jgi:hypothetical protein